jgi:aldose 1-epimerase
VLRFLMTKGLPITFALASVLLVLIPAHISLADDQSPRNSAHSSSTTTPFGHTVVGKAVLYTLHNPHGMEVRITAYGGIVAALTAPDRTGHFDDVVLGYAELVACND